LLENISISLNSKTSVITADVKQERYHYYKSVIHLKNMAVTKKKKIPGFARGRTSFSDKVGPTATQNMTVLV